MKKQQKVLLVSMKYCKIIRIKLKLVFKPVQYFLWVISKFTKYSEFADKILSGEITTLKRSKSNRSAKTHINKVKPLKQLIKKQNWNFLALKRALNQKANQNDREGIIIRFSQWPSYKPSHYSLSITFYFYTQISV